MHIRRKSVKTDSDGGVNIGQEREIWCKESAANLRSGVFFLHSPTRTRMFGQKAKETRIKIQPTNWPSNNWPWTAWGICDLSTFPWAFVHAGFILGPVVRRMFVTLEPSLDNFLLTLDPTSPLFRSVVEDIMNKQPADPSCTKRG